MAKGASNIQTEKINTQKLIDYLNSKKFIDGEEIVEQSILDEFARDVKTFIN